ncbi:hypothetical protein [Streptomyces sp. NPDC001508]|uniref:hypothetical protein n=1 Tax=Streptomyces sp. NPDC001508 TaxID=3154656 RepID=UPI0033252782
MTSRPPAITRRQLLRRGGALGTGLAGASFLAACSATPGGNAPSQPKIVPTMGANFGQALPPGTHAGTAGPTIATSAQLLASAKTRHPDAVGAWLDFLISPRAATVFLSHGVLPSTFVDSADAPDEATKQAAQLAQKAFTSKNTASNLQGAWPTGAADQDAELTLLLAGKKTPRQVAQAFDSYREKFLSQL